MVKTIYFKRLYMKIYSGTFISFAILYLNIHTIGGTWPVLLGPPDLNNCPIVKGAKTVVLVYS